MKRTPLLFFFVLFSTYTKGVVTSIDLPRTLATDELRAHAQAKVFQLVTKVKTGAEKQSYGTAFVIHKDGFLITNYHVVSEVVLNPDKYVLQLMLGNQSLPATVINVDIPNDLALIRVSQTFKNVYPISTRLLKPGEKVYSVGIPEDTVLSIVEGLFSDLRRSGAVSRLFFSAPLNHGMSGGPLLNQYEELVGINDAKILNAQNISIAIPTSPIASLCSNLDQNRLVASMGTEHNRQFLNEQVKAVLDPWIESWAITSQKEAGPTLGSIQISSPPNGMKCWQDIKKDSGKFGGIGVYQCETPDSFSLTEGRQGGEMFLKYHWIQDQSRKEEPIFALMKSGFDETFQKTALNRFAAQTHDDAVQAKYICHHRFVRSASHLLAEFCTTESIPGSKIYDLVLTAIPLDREAPFFAEMHLRGFTEDALIHSAQIFMESIRTGGEQ